MLSKKIGLNNILPYIKGKRILMRVDFNVPMKEGKIKDPTRIVETLPSIKSILENNPKSLVLMSHLGRPNGKVNESMSMRPLQPVLEDYLQKKVNFVQDFQQQTGANFVQNPTQKNQIFMLENLRFNKEEEGSYKDNNNNKIKADQLQTQLFRKNLQSFGDIYVNDAFGTSHRAHSSIVGINYPIRAAGHLLKKELDYFSKVVEQPQRPYLVCLGGAKVADKIRLITNLLDKVDEMIIGGAMAFTFLKYKGVNVGSSLVDDSALGIVEEIEKLAQQKGVKLHLPVDFICADKIQGHTKIETFDIHSGIPNGFMGLDSGPLTNAINNLAIAKAHTIVWNGPQGVFEQEEFRSGSLNMLRNIINRTKEGATSIAGGGDTLNVLKYLEGSSQQLSHVSTGGGASLELLEGKQLPGVLHLTDIDELKRLN